MLNLCLFYLNEILSTYNKNLSYFVGLPKLPLNYNPNDTILQGYETNKFIRDQKNYDKSVLKIFIDSCANQLNVEQLAIYNRIIFPEKFNHGDTNNLFFVDGPGGTGKTFLYNTILAKKR